ncbi:MAG: class I SAM-dependent methyltransferase [Deltaproteobacteria bacterium]|nr:class I SAM-dependent methyltransferase [Deltaproteobacteria bacterium]
MTEDTLNNDRISKVMFGARVQTLERLKLLYNQEYFGNEELAKDREMMYRQEFQRLRAYFNLDMGGNILDIGCGTGGFLSQFDATWRKYGIEISDYARGIARSRGIVTDFELQDDFFDLILFRGTLQHIPDPVSKIEDCYYWLKNGGGIAFLATPNTNSIYYKFFNSLPMLGEAYNFLLPSDTMLQQILTNFGFKIKGFEYPYADTPYARPMKDVMLFLMKLLRIRKDATFAFYRNVMECYAAKEHVHNDDHH